MAFYVPLCTLEVCYENTSYKFTFDIDTEALLRNYSLTNSPNSLNTGLTYFKRLDALHDT